MVDEQSTTFDRPDWTRLNFQSLAFLEKMECLAAVDTEPKALVEAAKCLVGFGLIVIGFSPYPLARKASREDKDSFFESCKFPKEEIWVDRSLDSFGAV